MRHGYAKCVVRHLERDKMGTGLMLMTISAIFMLIYGLMLTATGVYVAVRYRHLAWGHKHMIALAVVAPRNIIAAGLVIALSAAMTLLATTVYWKAVMISVSIATFLAHTLLIRVVERAIDEDMEQEEGWKEMCARTALDI